MEAQEGLGQATAKVNVETLTFTCRNCGGTVKYDIDSGTFRCASCRAQSAIDTLSDSVQEYDFSQYAARERESVAFNGMAISQCQNCGYEVAFGAYEIATTCPMCGSTQVAPAKQAAGIPPEGIIPFKIDKDDARAKFKAWAKSRWFAPNDFKKKYGEGVLTGTYLPFWTYDATAIAFYQGRGGTHRTVRDKDGKPRTVTDWTFVSGTVSDSFDDIQVCASDREKEISGILPFHTVENTKPYDVSYLSGFQAELYKIKADQGFETAKRVMESKLRSLAEQDILRHYDAADVNSLSAKFLNVTYKHLLLPVWGSTFGYQGKTYHYFVNGETGKIAGQRPYSAPKIITVVLAALAILVALYLLFR